MNSSAAVIAIEISNEPRQPSRFEKKKNMGWLRTAIDPAAARP
jgi:aryl-phospho-beta-D-glucosidase BglC (GH1 family)